MTDFTDIHITKQEALDAIYDCFDRWLSFSPDDEYEEGEIRIGATNSYSETLVLIKRRSSVW
jgi:hypothetical protein